LGNLHESKDLTQKGRGNVDFEFRSFVVVVFKASIPLSVSESEGRSVD